MIRLCFLVLLTSLLPLHAVDFSREIRPILSENCFFCHGPDEKKREAGLRLDDETEAKKNRDGVIAVVPGEPEKSALLQRVLTTDPDEVMPPPKQHKVIPKAQIQLLHAWIKQGAPWGKHWSYEKVRRPTPPQGEKHPVDAFLAQRLHAEGLRFSPPADRSTLLRRLSLDLTGLPPTPEEISRFHEARQPDLAAAVDFILAKPAYGEHWAAQWLDLARYADSSGYPSDQPREIWAYRDWVIRALNQNMPFDRFTREQIAGDLLPSPTDDQLIATAFHRNTMTQNEGGTSDEEFRNAAVIDRVNTTFAVWMGTTMACAQCHTHKYDPITLREFFQVYAIFNQSADSDKKDEVPLHQFETAESKAKRDSLHAEKNRIEQLFAHPSAAWLTNFDEWQKSHQPTAAWQPVQPETAASESRVPLLIKKDGSLHLESKSDRDSHSITAPIQAAQITALRLQTEAGQGNFVLTQLKAEILPSNEAPAPKAKHVRIELPGKKKMLQLAEVQVISAGKNISLHRPAKQSSQYNNAEAKRAVDGKTVGDYHQGSVSHTGGTDDNAWWEVELAAESPVESVIVWNRTDGGAGSRLEGFQLVLLDAEHRPVWNSGPTPAPKAEHRFTLGGPQTLVFHAALASHEQSGFPAASLLETNPAKKAGWAISPRLQEANQLSLLLKAPVAVPKGSRLRVTLEQKSPYPRHTLSRYRLSYSADSQVGKLLSLPAPVITALTTPAEKRSPADLALLKSHYARHFSPQAKAERDQLTRITQQIQQLKPITVPIMRDLPEKDRRVTRVQLRGNWQDLAETVTEATPSAFHPLPAHLPKNRLTFADWLVSPENPLTARVQVNRLWETLFGVGIVRSSEEFGSQGDLPLNPELLDWLAAEFMQSGWNVKHMIKLLVTSRAYQQSSHVSPELAARDPDNRWLGRGPRFRPTGELLRDQALAVSGLLSPKMYGPGVRPLSPNLGLSTAFGRSNDWTTSSGEDRYRRSIYTEVRRNAPYASFTTFDAGNREVCMIKRSRTNTPLQAFVTLNDPVFIETHQAMARRLLREAPDLRSRLHRLFQLCLARTPQPTELTALEALYAQSLQHYQKDLTAATAMATDPLGPAEKGQSIPELAALTSLTNVVMNLDEFLMRR